MNNAFTPNAVPPPIRPVIRPSGHQSVFKIILAVFAVMVAALLGLVVLALIGSETGPVELVIGLILGAGGIALLFGVVLAAALKNILFKVNALDPTIYFAVAGLLTLVAALSCFVPARRATRVDPMVALRYE